MMAIEDRTRDTLHEMADSVPQSQHPRADFERRLAHRRATRWRMPALATAAAALVVVAGVAVPLAMNRPDDARGQRPAASTPARANPDGTEASPWILGAFTENGVEKSAVLWTADGQFCMALRPAEPNSASPPGPTCEAIPAWPNERGSQVDTRGVFSEPVLETGPLANLLLFVTSPEITTLVVRHGDGTPVADVRTLGGNDRATFYLADFGGSTQGFGYDATDAQGNIVESAIT
jgi:hypothetical protein